jgi:hypothetical protein
MNTIKQSAFKFYKDKFLCSDEEAFEKWLKFEIISGRYWGAN